MPAEQNILLMTDSYKASHYKQYPPNAAYLSSYIESRGCMLDWTETVFFGLQAFLMEYLSKPITLEMINEADMIWRAHGEPFNREGWMYILNEHDGRLPVRIQAVPEGTILPVQNVMVQLVNTDPKLPWLTSFLETALLRAIWYPTTVATNSFYAKKAIYAALQASADDPAAEIGFKLHDFGARGVASSEAAALGGMGHLVNFMGTDTIEAVVAARRYYGCDMAGFSIPAAEHSTITCWGGPGKEIDAMRNMIEQFLQPGSMAATVSDSYDIFRAVEDYWGSALREAVEASGGTMVIRPDSGDPTEVPIEVIERLMNKVGFDTNSKGYKVLPPYFRVLQGDGIDESSLRVILDRLLERNISVSNIAFGMGGGLLQQVNRDTLKFAMKASAIKETNDYAWRDVFKDPVTDHGKQSKRGRLALIQDTDGYHTRREDQVAPADNLLRDVFVDGKILIMEHFEDIRARAATAFVE